MSTKQVRLFAFALFLLTLLVLLTTVAPSIHTSDSPELASAATELGIPHAPSYPLYMLIAHITTYLPLGDIAFRLNLLSVFATALCAPILFRYLYRLSEDWRIATGTTMMLLWSNGMWSNGLIAEVYALQLLTICIAITSLLNLFYAPTFQPKQALTTGTLFGLAVAMHPANVLFAPAFAVAFIWKYFTAYRSDLPVSASVIGKYVFLSGFISIGIFGLSLLYFPLRYADNPSINAAGYYDEQCQYQTVNLQSVSGVAWLVSGRQFASKFLADGWIPSVQQLGEGLRWFWLNFLGVGAVIGFIGLWSMAHKRKKLLILWLILIVPYTYFFLTYDANDRFAMLSPTYLLWTIPLVFGFRALSEPKWLRWLPIGFAVIILCINYPLINLRNNTEHHDRTLLILENIPQNAAVFGHWHDIVAMRYFQVTESVRDDITLYNLFFFNDHPHAVNTCIEQHFLAEQPVIFLDTSFRPFLNENLYGFQTIFISQRYNPPLYLQVITREAER